MNKILVLLSTITALISGPSYAMSGHYGLSSDYMWRGVSQSDGKPAINFSLEQEVGAGFYGGVTGSSVDFNDGTKIEYDLYGGYKYNRDKFSLDVGYMSYRYDANSDSRNFEEKYVVLGYDAISIGHASGMHDALDYDWVDLKVPFIDFADVTLHYGDYDGVKDKSVNIEYALSDTMSLGVLIQSNVRDDHIAIGDAVSVHFKTVF